MKSSKIDWLNFWSQTDNVGHAYNNSEWHKKYAKELLLFINPNKNKIAIDTGCGGGEIMIEMAPYFKKIHGIDYSSKMIIKAEENLKKINNVSISYLDMLSIKKMNIDEVERFLIESQSKLNLNGKIYLFNIPNKVYIDSFGIGLYRRKNNINWKKLIVKIASLHFDILKEKLKKKNYIYDGGLGNWYNTNDFKLLGKKLNLEVEFFSPIYLHHSYRFHAIFKKKNDILQ